MHGYDQSVTLTRAAQALSKALAAGSVTMDGTRVRTLRQWQDVQDADIAYHAARLAYTNPFRVEKTTY